MGTIYEEGVKNCKPWNIDPRLLREMEHLGRIEQEIKKEEREILALLNKANNNGSDGNG